MAAHKKQFCPHGHDTAIVGRSDNGRCKTCYDAAAVAYRKRNVVKIRALNRLYKEMQRLRAKIARAEASGPDVRRRYPARWLPANHEWDSWKKPE